LAYKNVSGVEKCNRNGVHQLTCPERGKKYAGQTGRSFHKSCNEHLQFLKYWKLNSAFAKHLHDSLKFYWEAASRCEGFPTFWELTS
jgi:hypothetical protein